MDFIIDATLKAVKQLYNTDITAADVSLQQTLKEFEGQVTVVIFPFTKMSRKSPEQTGTDIGEYLKANVKEVAGYNVIKGFLNISIADNYWLEQFYTNVLGANYSEVKPNGKKVMVEYSSPNTNKPLHLGHIRNNLLGYSVAQILSAAGYDVVKANLVNDRGIHICKSMLAWQKFGNGETPESSGIKGDHLVGKYYVIFDKEYKKQTNVLLNKIYEGDFSDTIFSDKEQREILDLDDSALRLADDLKTLINDISVEDISYLGQRFELIFSSLKNGDIDVETVLKRYKEEYKEESANKADYSEKTSFAKKLLEPVLKVEKKLDEKKEELKEKAQRATPLMQAAQQMLQKWEAGDKDVISLWETMNGWVYAGFEKTYNSLGVDFDKYYYESNTYLLGKDIVEEGLASGVFFQKEDGSVWIDLTADGLDQKLVRRGDGTSVYITQDMGTAQLKYDDYQVDQSIYVVGNEQDYHFKVLFLILEKLGKSWAKGLYHLSYGMVDLPSGKMKSREGTVVDADDLIAEMEATAKEQTEALGKVEGFSEEEKNELYHTIGMGALKYFLLKVEPKKRLLFDPSESIDFQGHTGPFIQYTHARIRSVVSRAEVNIDNEIDAELSGVERDLVILLTQYRDMIQQAAKDYNPAAVANYVYELAKAFNKFYHEKSILQADTQEQMQFRLQLATASAAVIKAGMKLLGMEVPERM